MEGENRGSPTRAGAGAGAGEPAGEEESDRGSPTRARARAGERAGKRVMKDPVRGSPECARTAKGTTGAAGPSSPADEVGVVSAEEMGGAAAEFCADLPEEVIYIILSKLPPCNTEQWAFKCLNQSWNTAVGTLFKKNPAQMPSIILPSSCDPLFHSTTSCQWHEEKLCLPEDDCLWKKLYLPTDVMVHGTLCGSSEGGWFTLVLNHADPKEHKNYLFNINTRDMKELPDTVHISEEIVSFNLEAAVVSSSPSLPGYNVAAIGKDPNSLIAVKRYDMMHWENVRCRLPPEDHLVDLIFYKSAFWFLSAQERIGRLGEEQDEMGNLKTFWLEMTMQQRESYISDEELAEKTSLTIKRYLVVSKDELYMVVRVLSPTIEIKIFRLQLNDTDDSSDSGYDSSEWKSDHLYYTWINASNELPDRSFFIGKASSRSFKTTSPPRIYFLHDGSFEDPTRPGYFIRDDMGFVAIREGMQYEIPEVYPVLGHPGPDRSSDRLPPSWWIH